MGLPVLSRAMAWYLMACGACPNAITMDTRTDRINVMIVFMIE
jgi:hypothetical protein